jgi:SEC-C motif-containing protein
MASTAQALLPDSSRCPCLSGSTYGECCAPYHRGEAFAPTAERLMRSRYSAFVVRNTDYLLATWHASTRPDTLTLDADQRFYRLDIEGASGGGLLESTGTVDFVAHSVTAGTVEQQHENSRFVKESGRWFYLSAI